MEISLDTSQVNVLLIEVAERFLRMKTQSDYIEKIKFLKNKSQSTSNKNINQIMTAGLSISKEDFTLIYKCIYNPSINQNLEFNLFDYPVFTPFKEIRAWLNFKLFGNVPQEISVIDNCPFLFLRETVDSNSDQSSFKYLPDEEVKNIVMRLNSVYQHYKNNGFTKVVFSIVPNPVSLISPSYKKYNNIIRRVQNHPGLIIPMINIYDRLDSAGCQVYYNSDSHWNCNGFNLWVNEFNKYLQTVSKMKN